jgi:ArsR family transcriptional regulator, arsenate/arsenite/antimonite-responsive transcriptional repressor
MDRSSVLSMDIDTGLTTCCAPVTLPGITEGDAGTLATVFKALSDPSRVRIVNLLANSDEPVCVCEFMPELGLSQGTVSFHLKKLLDAGMLRREQRGTWAYYSLEPGALKRLSTVFEVKGRRR